MKSAQELVLGKPVSTLDRNGLLPNDNATILTCHGLSTKS